MTNSQATAYGLRLESSSVRVGERGRITVPARFRKRLGIKRGDTFSIVQVDSFLILTPREFVVPGAANAIARIMEERGLTLEEMLAGLVLQRDFGAIPGSTGSKARPRAVLGRVSHYGRPGDGPQSTCYVEISL